MILNEYLAMCEGGWNPTVVLHTTVEWSPSLLRMMRQKTFCYRINSSFPITLDMSDKSIGTALSAVHRETLKKQLHNYDLFIYHEDDIIVKNSHVVGYLHETKMLHHLLPENGLQDHVIGFQRYRRVLRPGEHHRGNFEEIEIYEQENMEEVPNLDQICVKDTPYIKVSGNTHQAMWMFTKQQILMLHDKCGFLDHKSASREYMSSFSQFDVCHLTKLLPAARLYTFTVYHYYHQRHVSWQGVYTTEEELMNPKGKNACWQATIQEYNEMNFPSAEEFLKVERYTTPQESKDGIKMAQ